MNPGPPESTKRPRLSTASSWASGAPHGALSLPPPPPQHTVPPRPYQPHYPRASESHAPPPPHQVSPLHTPRPGQHHQHPDDRRHHEHEQFAPMQDFRQPPPSPAHVPPQHGAPPPNAFSAPYPAREPVIKRDSTDEHVSGPRRPPSTGSGPENQPLHPPPMNAGSHPPPHQPSTAPSTAPPHPGYPEDPRRHMSFDGGPPMPGTPGGYPRPSSYPPPGPVPHQHSYEPVYQNDPYLVQYASSSSKKKTTRASQACDSCRALKAKCDETKPCKNCKEKGIECNYREPAPKPTDKAQADIMEGVNKVAQMIAQAMETQTKDMRRMGDRIERIEKALLQLNPQLDLKSEAASDEDKPLSLQDHQMDAPPDSTSPDPAYPSMYDMADEEVEKEPGPPVSPGQPSIPTNHTTGAGYLLSWPCINDMLHDSLRKEGIGFLPEFPIQFEERRGTLRVYGRGEGRDPVLRDKDSRAVHGSAEIPDESYPDFNSPTPGDSSGYIGGFSPGSVMDNTTSSPRPLLNQSGIPDFAEGTVWTYVRVFEEHILNMHPIILPSDLRTMVQNFLNSIPKPSKTFNPAHTASFVPLSPQPPTMEATGTKRKRSPGVEVPDTPQLQHRIGRPTRTINNAVVLTILALGKICSFRDGVPDVVHDDERSRNGYPSSPHASSPEAYTPNAPYPPPMMSPRANERPGMSRRASFQGSKPSQMRRNYESIPGLEYFAIATDIIGNQLGGNTLNHVYSSIFAGLYHGQLGRVIESHAYIAHGCTVLMNILRPSLKRLSTFTQVGQTTKDLSVRDNQLLFAFWTCLQLESDIIAEIPRHQSGISAQEDNLPYPNILGWLKSWQQGDPNPKAEEPVSKMIESYTAQLYLRKHLNQIHRKIYSDNTSNADLGSTLRNLNDAYLRVEAMKWVGPAYKFNEDDPPANDILAARLRAKYWGAQVITYRPCIKAILDLSFDLRCKEPGPGGRMAQTHEEVSPNVKRQLGELGQEVWDHARKGIRALVESTQAFHGLGEKRPIITNVFGTAHAQWGNLLVLAACYRDPFLRQEVDGDKLRDLFLRTMNFLRQVSTFSSALSVDRRLLDTLYRILFPEPSYMIHPKASFSSTASGTTPGQAQLSPPGPAQGQGNVQEPMGPPRDPGGMMVPPAFPVGGPPPGPLQREMMGHSPTQAGGLGSVPTPPMVTGPMGPMPMDGQQPATAPPHHPNLR